MFEPRLSKDRTFNLCSLLKTKGYLPKAMFKFARACSRASAAENPKFHVG